MKPFVLFVVSLLSLACISTENACSGWGSPGPCPVGQYVEVRSWRQHFLDEPQMYEYLNNTLVGAYDYAEGYYRSYDAVKDSWGEKVYKEAPEGVTLPAVSPITKNFGVYRDQETNTNNCTKPTYRINGKEVSRQEVVDALEKGTPYGAKDDLKDDSKLGHITIISPDASVRAQVVKDLNTAPSLAAFKGKYQIWACSPTHFSVKDCGFKTDGHPTVYCQDAEGKVLHRQDNYTGPEDLAAALRRVDPTYDPAKDPDRRQAPIFGFEFSLHDVPPPVWVLVIVGGVFVFGYFHKKHKS